MSGYRCPKYVSEGPWYAHTHRCDRRATQRVEDKPTMVAFLCKTHANAWNRRNDSKYPPLLTSFLGEAQ